nr:integrase, catalytic region, zinc finger, CCHC-type, peptidase aspartic, catalytic [Tanacetum cinerariifolium]
MGYGDYKIGNVTISMVYVVEGLGPNLFSVGQFCDSDLEVAFRQHTCFICNLNGVDLLTGSRGNNLYTLSLQDMMASSPIFHQQFEFSQADTRLVVLVFQKGDDPIDAINPMMSFLNAVVTSRYPPTNKQLRTSSNPRQQATINNGRFKDKLLLVQAQANGQVLHEEELEFLADLDCDEINSAKITLMMNLSHYGSDNLAESLEIDNLKHTLSEHLKEKESLEQKEKVLVITALKDTLSKIKGKVVVNEAVPLHLSDPELLKIDAAPLALKLQNNMTAHNDYLKHTQEETDTLRAIVKNERLLNLLNTFLDYACKYTKHIQDLLIILKQTCPCINDLGTKLMVVTPKNNNKKIRFTEHIPSSRNTPVKTTSSTNVVSNTHVLSSTGVNLLSNASGSQPQGNTKKDRIRQTKSKAKKNKLEDHSRTVRPSLNNKKSVVNTKAISSVPNSKLNVNSDLKCATCNRCLFYDNHDLCVLEFINFVNARVKSKSTNQ